MPEYSLRHGRYKGSKVIEILKDGESFWEDIPGAQKHFSFGTRKAVLFLGAQKLIREFVDSEGALSEEVQHSVTAWGDCQVIFYSGFERKGKWVNRPYIRIDDGSNNIGIGLLKSEAVLQHMGEIEKFAQDNY